MKIITIISANYIAYAKTLASSVEKAGHGKLLVLIVDRKSAIKEVLDGSIDFDFIFAEDLGITNINEMAFKYDITEFNTALKPFFLEYVIDHIDDRVVYLDPDIFVYNRLIPIEDALQRSSILLTPHSTSPVMDGFRPSDIDFMRTGLFNLGFIALKKCDEVKRFLGWWKSRCEALCFNDTAFGTFVDQKWIDLVPCYFSGVEILKTPGLNVAYWNIHERNLSNDGGKYSVNDEPLYFFHYSGVDIKRPRELSKHQNRTLLASNQALNEIFSNYMHLLSDNWVEAYQKIPYSFNYLSDGSIISPLARRALLVYGNVALDPFDAQGDFQKALRKSGLQSEWVESEGSVNTQNFDKYRKIANYVNIILRVAVLFLGAARVFKLLRYFSILSRESHFQSILLRREIDFLHSRKQRSSNNDC